jgi:hypothetical protein
VGERNVKSSNGKITNIIVPCGNGIELIKTRKVDFGYVLPNLYLKERLANDNDTKRSVARIFLKPKSETVKFKFKMPYAPPFFALSEKELCHGDGSENPLEVMTQDFDVYQEWIEGSDQPGNKIFGDLGHRDNGPVQIIRSNKDEKQYLVDTKEKKNFFAPHFSPYNDYFLYTSLNEQFGINDNEDYETWKKTCRTHIYDVKSLHFDPRVIYVEVNVKGL